MQPHWFVQVVRIDRSDKIIKAPMPKTQTCEHIADKIIEAPMPSKQSCEHLADKIIKAPMPSILVMQPHWYASAWTRILMAQVLQHGHAIMNLDSQSSCTVHVVASSHLKM